MKLLRDQVVIRPLKDDSGDFTTASGIVMPTSQQPLWAEGEVVLLGEYSQKHQDGSVDPWPYKVGDIVVYQKGAVMDWNVSGMGGAYGLKLIGAYSINAVLEAASVAN